MVCAVIDYGMGNVHSVAKALRRVGAEVVRTDRAEDLMDVDRIVLPGVGHFAHGMERLRELKVIPALETAVFERNIPLLGICLGLQLLSDQSEEGNVVGLGWIKADTVRITPTETQPHLRVPHIGWNTVDIVRETTLLADLPQDSSFYFVHSYHVVCENEDDVVAYTSYGGSRLVAAVARGNIVGTQFHPEKSHGRGLRVLQNFIESSNV